jgi:SNF2 family DNA or RNA helicase
MGQTKPVRVFQLIAADTIEAKVLDIRESALGQPGLD